MVKISTSKLFVGLAIAALAMASVHAQPYPAKPVRFIVPFPAGGSADTLARIAATKLSERWAQQVVVDNRGGAGGNIGADILAKSPPDGHTLMMGTVALAISAGLYRKLPFDVAKDFAPVTLVASAPMILVVHPSVPAKSVQELIALAKRQPGTLTFASAGNGTPSHLAGELFAKSAEVRMVHVPYKAAHRPSSIFSVVKCPLCSTTRSRYQGISRPANCAPSA